MPSLALSEALAAPCRFVSAKPFLCWSVFHDSSACVRAPFAFAFRCCASPWAVLLRFVSLWLALARFVCLNFALSRLNLHYFAFCSLCLALSRYGSLWLALPRYGSLCLAMARFGSLWLHVSFLRSAKSKNAKRGELK